MNVSIFGSWARPKVWPSALINFSNAAKKVSYEIVIAGPHKPTYSLPPNMTFIHVEPDRGFTHCSQIAERQCKGETLILMGDDCRFSADSLDNMYMKFQQENDYKCMVHSRWGTGPKNDITDLHPYLFETPDPNCKLGFVLWSKKFFDELGGYDRRFTFGSPDSELQLRSYANGGRYVYAYDAFFYEDLNVQGNTFNGAWYQKGGYKEVQELIWGRWYSNGEQYGGTLLKEPRTPFEPIRD